MGALIAMVSDLQRRHEGAVARLGQLEGEREQRLALEDRARSLVEREAQARAEAEAHRRRAEELIRAEEEARAEVGRQAAESATLRQQLRRRTFIAAVALVAAAASLGVWIVRYALK